MKPHKKRLVLPYLLVTPALVLLAAFMLYPMLSNLAISLFQYKLTSRSEEHTSELQSPS